MPLLINIDTATEIASVCITANGRTLDFLKNESQKEHASFVHTAIAEMLRNTACNLTDIDAFAVTSGPGSYTGLRVGMAAAKGFCYALSKPLIIINTLEVMTKAAIDNYGLKAKEYVFCPMIDARRMEVFTAIYNSGIKNVLSPQAVILEKGIFNDYLATNKVLFFGSGSIKFKQVQYNDNAVFEDIQFDARSLGKLAEDAFNKKQFANLPHSAPTYIKDFHFIQKS